MTGGSNIRAIGADGADNTQGPTEQSEEIATDDASRDRSEASDLEDAWLIDEGAEPPQRGWILPAFAGMLIVGWTTFFGWTLHGDIAANAVTPAQVRDWLVDWSVPVLLVGVAWILIQRNSTREAQRFGETAAMLSKESSDLEHRLAATNRELSLAREFLAAQSRDLDSLGRVASERISQHAEELQSLIKSNGDQVDAIGSASGIALSNMTKLRDDLPVIANSAKDASNQIGSAGRTADDQLAKLIAGFERLNAFGQASEQQVTALSSKIDQTLETFGERLEAIEAMASERFEALTAKSEEYRTELDKREVHALAAMKERADDLRAELTKTSDTIAEQNNRAIEGFNERVALLQSESAVLSDRIRTGEANALSALSQSKDTLYEEISEVIQNMAELDQRSIQTYQDRLKALYEEAGRFEDALETRDRTFLAEMAKRQDEFDTRETQASELLAQRLATLDEALQERRDRQIAEMDTLLEQSQAISAQLELLSTTYQTISEHGEATHALLGTGLSTFDEQLANSGAQLVEAGKTMDALTDSGVRLLEIIQSGAQQSREDLSNAIEGASARLSSVEQRATEMSGSVDRAAQSGTQLLGDLEKAQDQIDQADAAIEALRSQLAESADEALAKLTTMQGSLEKLSQDTHTLTGDTQDTLRDAIAKLEQATHAAFETIETGTHQRLDDLASSAGAKAVAALERSLRNESAEAIGRLEQSASHASGIGREAAAQLRDQLSKVNELTGNLEQRVARARELAEQQTNNDFVRRMALITDSLNSASIDIASALSTEVADTAWDAYLKGDRGIFSRRAVRLLDSGETREIVELYQLDEEFKETVNRYIHDFEAMLRTMLSTRDGNALSVTLLGSDIGKLYVILAQAIERFRN